MATYLFHFVFEPSLCLKSFKGFAYSSHDDIWGQCGDYTIHNLFTSCISLLKFFNAFSLLFGLSYKVLYLDVNHVQSLKTFPI